MRQAKGNSEEQAKQSRREVSSQIMDTDQCNQALGKDDKEL